MPLYNFSGLPLSDTWANTKALVAPTGTQRVVTDVGNNGMMVWYNGTRWIPMGGNADLMASAVPLIIPPSGTMGNNGALSALATALPATFAKCYLYMPANAIAAGSAAGWYYAEMSSTTAGTVFNNTYTSGRPTFPTSGTAFSTTGPGAYTQTTGANITSLSFTVPGGMLDIGDSLLLNLSIYFNNSATTKSYGATFGASNITTGSRTTSTHDEYTTRFFIHTASNQHSIFNSESTTASTAAYANLNRDVTVDNTMSLNLQLNTAATDFIMLLGYNCALFRG